MASPMTDEEKEQRKIMRNILPKDKAAHMEVAIQIKGLRMIVDKLIDGIPCSMPTRCCATLERLGMDTKDTVRVMCGACSWREDARIIYKETFEFDEAE